MNSYQFATSVLLALCFSLLGEIAIAQDSVRYSRPVFASDRSVRVSDPEPVLPLVELDSPFSDIAIFEAAAHSCGLDLALAARSLETLLLPESKVWSALSNVFDTPIEQLRTHPARLLLDDFGERPRGYRSFFLRAQKPSAPPAIVLDCRRPEGWEPALAHEIVHALLVGTDVPSWLDEMVAQLVETEAGGTAPEKSLDRLGTLAVLPVVFQTHRPLPSSESYAVNALLGRYVFARHGWTGVREMLNGKSHMPGARSERGLLRNFAVAASLRQKDVVAYEIPGLERRTEPPTGLPEWSSVLGVLASSQILRLSATSSSAIARSGLEAYRVVSWEYGFKIFPLTRKEPKDLDGQLADLRASVNGGAGFVQDFVLVLP
jgi:hypothetical protein